jgi:hypothetical protein
MFGGHANGLAAVADVNNDGIDDLLLEAIGGQPEIQGDASLVSFRGGEPHVVESSAKCISTAATCGPRTSKSRHLSSPTPRSSSSSINMKHRAQGKAPMAMCRHSPNSNEWAGVAIDAIWSHSFENPASVLTQTTLVRACLFGGAILVLTTVLHSQPGPIAEFRPKIPKVWVEAEVAGMELPLAAPAPPITNISARETGLGNFVHAVGTSTRNSRLS